MEGSIKIPEQPKKADTNTTQASTISKKEVAGKIASHIGTGRNAKDSFIWMTITWSFYIATGISVLLFTRSFFSVAAGEDILDALIKVWSVFVPIITLALGYAFGKGE
jgi:uncharacterized membrane protein YdbT with pleckstrin-like domain